MFFSYLSLPYCSTPALFIFSPLKHLRSVGVNYLLSLPCLPCKPRICWSQLCFVTCITWWENDKLLFYFLSSQYNWSSDYGRQQSSPASVTFSNSALEEEKKKSKKVNNNSDGWLLDGEVIHLWEISACPTKLVAYTEVLIFVCLNTVL